MAHVILLEDEPVLREEVAEFLQAQGHQVAVAGTVTEFLRTFSPPAHQVAVIDLGLPDGDGLDLIFRMRKDGMRLGIIILTARNTIEQKISGLVGGADYYLPKTAELSELAATIDALVRRMEVQEAPKWVLSTSPRQLIPPGHPPIALSGQDFSFLQALASGVPGAGVTRQTIVKALGGSFFEYDQRRLDTQMRRLRRKVQDSCGLELPVTTLRNVGYSFNDPIDLR